MFCNKVTGKKKYLSGEKTRAPREKQKGKKKKVQGIFFSPSRPFNFVFDATSQQTSQKASNRLAARIMD